MSVGPPRDALNRRRIDWLLRGVLLFLLVFQLFVPPALSIADSNDFQKLAGLRCLGHYPTVILFDYTNLHWRFSTGSCAAWPFRTSAELFFDAALALNRVFHSKLDFDLRWMGVVYASVFVAAFLWMQRWLRRVPLRTSVAAQAGFLLVACNAVYVPYFNTFFFDAATLVALFPAVIGTAAMLLSDEVDAKTMVVTALSLAILAASKSQHSLLALACLPAIWVARRRKFFPPIWQRAAATLAICAGGLVSIGSTPANYASAAVFNAFFYRILPGVDDPARYLAGTRLPASYIGMVGKHAYMEGTPFATVDGERFFRERFGTKDLAAFFVKHPRIAWRMLLLHLGDASWDRVRMTTGTIKHRLGNYEESVGKPPQSLSQFFCFWPYLKHAAIAGRPRIYLAYIAAVMIAAWSFAPRMPGMKILLAIVSTMLCFSLAIVMIDGVESGRHLMIFNFLLDLTVVAVAASAVHRGFGVRASLK